MAKPKSTAGESPKDLLQVEEGVSSGEAVIQVTSTLSRLNQDSRLREVVGEKAYEENISIRPFVSQTATVGVKGGATLNLGNFESARVDVFFSVPCYPEEVLDAFEFAKEFVDSKLAGEVKEIRSSTGGE